MIKVGDVNASLAQIAQQLKEAEERGFTKNITFA
jgi:hypothetical protein